MSYNIFLYSLLLISTRIKGMNQGLFLVTNLRIGDDESSVYSVQSSLSQRWGRSFVYSSARARPLNVSPLLSSSHPSIHRRAALPPPSAAPLIYPFRTVSILWRRTEAAGRWQALAWDLNGRHLDGNPSVRPGETGRALCCDTVRHMLTICEVTAVNRPNVCGKRGLGMCTLARRLKLCFIRTFDSRPGVLTMNLFCPLVMCLFYQRKPAPLADSERMPLCLTGYAEQYLSRALACAGIQTNFTEITL